MASGKSGNRLVLSMACILVSGAICVSSPSMAADSVDLWQVYETALKSAKYVDLTHTITPRIRHIDVELITDRPRYTVGYALKGLKRPTFSEDDVLVLPRAVSELPGRHPRHL
jgi:hypothetical protein